MKVVVGLGNPGGEYAWTRHNVAWWVLDDARTAWAFPAFRRQGSARVSEGRLGAETVRLVKPLTYVNRSGAAVAAHVQSPEFEVARDLLVVVDDAALDVARVRIRAAGSSGGHNGLKSVEAVLRSRDYARLRIGVGGPEAGEDLADWVLSPMQPEDEERIRGRIPDVIHMIRVWVEQGVEAAARTTPS